MTVVQVAAKDVWMSSTRLREGRGGVSMARSVCANRSSRRAKACLEWIGIRFRRQFFFTRPKARVRRRHARAARRHARVPRTNSAFFTVFFACAFDARAMLAPSPEVAEVAGKGVADAADVKLSKKSCARVVDSKKNRD